MTAADRLRALLAVRVLVLDGAIGTMLQRHAAVPNDMARPLDQLAATRRDIVSALHHAYLEAGADIIKTHTFAGPSLALAGGGDARALAMSAAQLARDAADDWSRRTPGQPRFVAGVIGPAAPLDAGAAAAHVRAYREQAQALIEGGVDLLLIETVLDTRGALAAAAGVSDACQACGVERPLLMSATVADRRGLLPSGETVAAFVEAARGVAPFALGLNCGLGARGIRRLIEPLAAAGATVICYPSAGLPDAFGDYDERPEDTASALGELAAAGLAHIVGGCCGTTPAHVRALAAAIGAADAGR